MNKQYEFLNKLNNIKIGKKTIEQTKCFLFFSETLLKCYLMLIANQKNETEGKRLKVLPPKQMIQRLP